jgi:eukaryotic-like serine/threonine-protein kinase
MSNPAPGNPVADRNLLFGILAVQMDFVSRDDLIAGMHTWLLAKHRALADILQEQGALKPGRRLLLDGLADEHVDAHDGDIQRSLAAVGMSPDVRAELGTITDRDVADGVSVIRNAAPAKAGGLRPEREAMRYEVLRPHARGGLGQVSVARDAELGREVALKEMHADCADDAVNRDRFVREAEVTGALEHPGIVPVYGLGRYADGRPYYAMRFVRGETLQHAIKRLHAGEPGYTLRGLLTRFAAVCNAVAYAHSRGVIHRDLKPANVMLGPFGETLVVDWGLAKVVGRSVESNQGSTVERTLQVGRGDQQATRTGSLLGTPEFMSPEQARGEVELLGPATDIYSLGATLFSVLTGRPPVQGSDPVETLEKVWQGDWPAPREVQPAVPAPLDAICRKAMALRPEERYATAMDLAADLEHWLADEAVAAYREPALARLRRWGRRHRPLVASAAALLVTATVALGIGLAAVNKEINQTVAALAAEQDAHAAEQEAKETAEAKEKTANEREAETRAVLDFVEKKVFAAARPKNQEGGMGYDVQLADALKAALPFVETAFKDQPLVEARLRMTLGQSFWYLGKWKIAADQYQAARTIYATHLGPDHPDTLRTTNNLANGYDVLGRHAEALKLRQETLALQKAKLGPDHRDTLMSMDNLANSYDGLGQFRESLKLHEQVLALYKAKLGPDHPDTMRSMNNLANDNYRLGRYAEAIEIHQETLVLRKTKLGVDHPDTLWSMNELANSYNAFGRHTEAIKLHEETLALRVAKLGPDHPDTLRSLNDLAVSYAAVGRHAEALKVYKESLAVMTAKVGSDHPNTLVIIYNIACVYALSAPKSADRVKQAELAMEWLKKAVAAGYKDIDQIRTDTDLDSLRDREDFKKLVADLEAKVAKEKK